MYRKTLCLIALLSCLIINNNLLYAANQCFTEDQLGEMRVRLPCIYSQNDHQWYCELMGCEDTYLGNCHGDLKAKGCLVTCLAMVYNYFAGCHGNYDADWNPKDLNSRIIQKNDYTNANYRWLTKKDPATGKNNLPIEADNNCTIFKGHTPGNLNKLTGVIKRELKKKHPIIAQLNGGAHYVVIVDRKKINNVPHFIIVDPWKVVDVSGKNVYYKLEECAPLSGISSLSRISLYTWGNGTLHFE